MKYWCLALLLCIGVHLSLQIDDGPGQGIGIAFSGAGGRLAQHLALADVLINGLNPSGQKIRPSYLSGASSGAITSVALNAILETEEKGTGTFTWDFYRGLLFALNSSDVYDNSWLGLAEIFTVNIPEGFILDNTPFENLLAQYLQMMGYHKLGDLYLPTSISIVNQSSGLDTRLWSNDPEYADLDLLEVMMASTALPMAFTPRTITGLGDTAWIDGGTGIDTIPVYPLLDNPNVTEIYIVCYGSAMTSGGGTVPWELDYIKILKNGLAVIDDMRVDLFAGAIDIARDSVIPTWTYIPALNESFSALDFSQEKFEYEITYQWAVLNDPTRIN